MVGEFSGNKQKVLEIVRVFVVVEKTVFQERKSFGRKKQQRPTSKTTVVVPVRQKRLVTLDNILVKSFRETLAVR